ncbi:MAG: isochorismate synthase [Myxococcales bacterium]|nr:isochorismate synthase [Myxococcales bacterium]
MPGQPHPQARSAARRVLTRATARAHATGQATLARLSHPAAPVGLAGGLRAALAAGEVVFGARDLSSGAAVFALGPLAGWGGTPATPAEARTLFTRAQARLVTEGDDPTAPLAVFALPFRPGPRRPDSPWAGAPAGTLWVPSAVWSRPGRGADWTLTRHVIVAPDAAEGPLLAALCDAGPPPALAGPSSPAVGPEPAPLEGEAAWMGRVASAVRACDAGALAKVVLARAVRYAVPAGERFDVAGTVEALLRREPETTVFALSAGAAGVFLGATPELLAEVQGRRIITQALAGTTGRVRDDRAADALARQALQASEKDGREHDAVVQGVREALAPVCPLLGGDTQPRLRTLASVHHLETRLEGRLRPGVGLLEVIEHLHPTPALGGAPRAEAGRWLAESEPLDRGWYGAPLGWLTPDGGGRAQVGIRSALVRPEAAVLFAGAGIVSGSDPAHEWRETGLKLQPVRAALHLERRRER